MRIKYNGMVASSHQLLSSLNIVMQNSSSFNNTVFRILSVIYYEINTIFLSSADKRESSYSYQQLDSFNGEVQNLVALIAMKQVFCYSVTFLYLNRYRITNISVVICALRKQNLTFHCIIFDCGKRSRLCITIQ